MKKKALTPKEYVDRMTKELFSRGMKFVLIVDDGKVTTRSASDGAWGIGACRLASALWVDQYRRTCQEKKP